MLVIEARDINEAWPQAVQIMQSDGAPVLTRNGDALVVPYPVTTRYFQPMERVLFDPKRDANPFFHLFEALWMLAGRNNVSFPARFVKRMADYSDDGNTFHSAYGHRWRRHWHQDQLQTIIDMLKTNPANRRCVLGIWDPDADLGTISKDLPCNMMVKFAITDRGLDAVVFNRSNDIIWGCYGANVVQFSMLQEYMAACIGVPVGHLWQVSCDWHTYDKEWREKGWHTHPYTPQVDVYEHRGVRPFPLQQGWMCQEYWDGDCAMFVNDPEYLTVYRTDYFNKVVRPMYIAWRDRVLAPLTLIDNDWHEAGRQWIFRRLNK